MKLFNKSTWCLLALSVLGSAGSAFGASAAQQLKLTFNDPALGGFSLPYNLFLPANYDPSGPALPVILYLHGAGERGNNNTSQINGSMQPLIDATQGGTGTQRAIVIAPQCPNGQVWNSINAGDNWTPGGAGISSYSETPAQQAARAISTPLQAAIDLLGNVQSTRNTDTKKVYVTGLSMGGFGTWDAITRFPEKFAAAMPLSGGGNKLAYSTLINEPVWAYHGTEDNIVYPNGSTDVINAIRSHSGTKSIYTLQGGTGHAGWNVFYTPYSNNPPGGPASYSYYVGHPNTTGGTPTYSGDTVYEWLFSQASVPEPASLGLLATGALLILRRTRKA